CYWGCFLVFIVQLLAQSLLRSKSAVGPLGRPMFRGSPEESTVACLIFYKFLTTCFGRVFQMAINVVMMARAKP
ncbi:hypothetical protein V2A87_22575, partial [Pseudomonas aeruginosa]